MMTMQQAYKNLLQKRINKRDPYYSNIDYKLNKLICLTNDNIKLFNEYNSSIDFDDIEDYGRFREVELLFDELITILQEQEIKCRDLSEHKFHLTIEQPDKIKEGKRRYYKVKFNWDYFPTTEFGDEECMIYAKLY